MRFGILGPLQVVDDDDRELPVAGSKPRAVLAILLLHANEVVSSDRLVEELWGGEPPASAAKSLQVHVSRLRRALGSDGGVSERLITAAGGYLLRVAPGELDSERFERLIVKGQSLIATASSELAVGKLDQALELWRGPPLSDFAYESFAQAEIARLSELQLAAVEQRIAAQLELGQEGKVIVELERLIREQPYRERLRGQLMLALYRVGRQAEALQAYRSARSALVEELGIEPSAELRELHEAILAQDASLRSAAPSRTAQLDGEGVFVGYEHELDVLKGALEDMLTGRGTVALIAGEPGIGKSRLAGRIGELAAARGSRLLWGRCWEAGGAPAYWPWVQALRSYLRDCSVDQLGSEAGLVVSELAQILPELRQRVPGVPESELAGSDDGRFRLFEAIAGLVRRASVPRPLVFVLDDVHAADEPSTILLRFLADALPDARVLIVAAYRDTEVSEGHHLRSTIAELTGRRGVHRIKLTGFGAEDTGRVVGLAAGERGPLPALAAAIHRSSDGNPLFVTELVRLLQAEGRFGELSNAQTLELPDGIGQVIERWLQRLSAGCRKTLSLAAVIGREFDGAVLTKARGRPDTEIVEDLEQAIAARLVADVPGSRGNLRFSHELVRDALYGDLSGARRARLHKTVADTLERRYAASVEPHLSEIAHHYLHAVSIGEARKAVNYARRAAEHAAGLLAYEEAIGLYELALETLEWTGAGRDGERGAILIELADQFALAGDVRRARPALADAAREADRLGDAALAARAAVARGEVAIMAGTEPGPEYIAPVERALAFFQEGDDPLHEARAWGVLRMWHHGVGRTVASGEAAERMLACARRAGSRALEAKALDGLAWSLVQGPTPASEAIPRLTQMVEQTHSPYARSQTLMGLAVLEGVRGRYAEARGLAENATSLMSTVGDVREHACQQAFWWSPIELWAGDFASSERLARSGCETFERLEANGWLTSALVCIVEALIPQGKLQEAGQVLSKAASLLADEHDLDAIERQARARALIELHSGEYAAAERSAYVAVETAMQAEFVTEQASNWLVLADVLQTAERAAEARDAAREALAIADRKGQALFTWRARSILGTHPRQDPRRRLNQDPGGNRSGPQTPAPVRVRRD
jgi:DNA-binding SARP family transcriptional activator